jgi:hypothetical protein
MSKESTHPALSLSLQHREGLLADLEGSTEDDDMLEDTGADIDVLDDAGAELLGGTLLKELELTGLLHFLQLTLAVKLQFLSLYSCTVYNTT